MPNFDKTGPEGKGPMTGMGRGKCEKSDNENSKTPSLQKGRRGGCCGQRRNRCK